MRDEKWRCTLPINPDRLTRYDCFRALTEDQRQAVAQLGEEECFYPEHVLFREGERGTQLFILDVGEVEVLYNIGDEGPARVDSVCGGEILGCSSLVEPYTYNSTVRCSTEIETLVLDAEALRKLMEEDCRIGYSIQNILIRKLLDRIMDFRLSA